MTWGDGAAMSDETKGATVMVPGCRHDNVVSNGCNTVCQDCATLVDLKVWRRLRLPPEPQRCRGCTRPLLLESAWMADGCPCNSPRGVNHGLVATNTCTCVECDPKKTGGTRWSVPTPPEPPKSWVDRKSDGDPGKKGLLRETVEECRRALNAVGYPGAAEYLRRAMLEPKA